MTTFMKRLKLAWLKAMEALGTSASNMASNAKFKVQEINLESRRREILTEFSATAFDLWQKGEALPNPLDGMLKELCDVDEKLSVLRAQKYAAPVAAKKDSEDEPPAPELPEAGTEPAKEETEVAPQEEPLEAAAEALTPEPGAVPEVSPENS